MGGTKESIARPTRTRGRFPATALVALIYVAVSYYSIKVRISPVFAYEGLEYRTPEPLGIIYATIVLVFTAIALPSRISKVSDFVLWILFAFAGAPSILVGQITNIVTQSDAYKISTWVAVLMIGARVVLSAEITDPAPRLHMTRHGFMLAICGYSCFLYLYLFLSGLLSTARLNLYDVYSVRAEFFGATSGDAVFGYLLPIQGYVLNPVLLGIGFLERKPRLIGLAIVGQFVLYSSTGYKMFLFSIPLILGIGFFFKRRDQVLGRSILAGVVVAAAMSLAVDDLLGTLDLTTLFVRRVLVLPGALTAAYVDIFSTLPQTNFAGTLGVGAAPYQSLGLVVGRIFINNPDSNATANLWAHGYASAGYLGMLIEMGVFTIAMVFANAFSRGLPVQIACFAMCMPALSVAESNIFTALATHSLAASILLCLIAPRDGWDFTWTQEMKTPRAPHTAPQDGV